MFKSKTPAPFTGWPRTRLLHDRKGKPRFEIEITALTPLRAKIADGVSILAMLGGMALTVTDTAQTENPEPWHWVAAIAVPILFQPLLKWMFRQQFKKTTRVQLTEDAITVRGFPKRTYDRRLRHSFSVEEHDESQHERVALARIVRQAARRGRDLEPTIYYGEARHLVLQHLGQRRDITAVFGVKEAEDASARLNACDDHLNSLLGKSAGTAFDPDDDWSDAPGGLPKP